MYVFDQNGKRYLDLCSGLWNMPLGYSERRIKAVVNKQMEQLPFSNLLVFSSDIQTQYAQRLLQWMGDFGCILYTCSGSETVEAAIKTCRQYQCLRNRPEHRRIAAFTLSYHGTSYGVMSVSGIDQILTDVYRPLVPEISWVTVPADYADEDAWRQAINGLWEQEGDYLAGFIVEPVMASGGVVPVPNPVLQHIQQRCRERDVLLVADEVATGFGRTGTPFAWQQAEITPDLVCLSKAINNGYLAEERGMFPKETVQQTQDAFRLRMTQSGSRFRMTAMQGEPEPLRVLERPEVVEALRWREGGLLTDLDEAAMGWLVPELEDLTWEQPTRSACSTAKGKGRIWPSSPSITTSLITTPSCLFGRSWVAAIEPLCWCPPTSTFPITRPSTPASDGRQRPGKRRCFGRNGCPTWSRWTGSGGRRRCRRRRKRRA